MTDTVARSIEKINIRPGVGVLSVISYIKYHPWYALAEFVDNAVQSSLSNQEALCALHGFNFKLKVEIEVEHGGQGRIVIRDNAAGIHTHEYERAFRPAALPGDRSGLNEFGMGMKTAACWFARRWQVRTKALGENVERTVSFDVESIVRDSIEELDIKTRSAARDVHYTEIVLTDLNHSLQTSTLKKVKEHLASIYRVFLREGTMDLIVGGEQLTYTDFKVLEAPVHVRPNEIIEPTPQRWYKPIEFDFGEGLKVTGFAALREVGSTTHAGFALFRRKRVIQGSGDDTYRPHSIFRNSNSYTWQRLSGELHLDGFEVSHTKDGFRWDDQEEPFLDLLKEYLDSDELPLLSQAENYRARPKSDDQRVKKVATDTTARVADLLKKEAGAVIDRQMQRLPEPAPPPFEAATEAPLACQEVDMELDDQIWRVRLEQTTDPGVGDWLSVDYGQPTTITTADNEERQLVVVRLAWAHPFMNQFAGARAEHLEGISRIAMALGLAEVAAHRAGTKFTSVVRTNLNELLREVLWKKANS